MIGTILRPMPICSDMPERPRQPCLCRGLTALIPALRGRFFGGLLLLGVMTPASATTAPIQTDFDDDQILVTLPSLPSPSPTTDLTQRSPENLADEIQNDIAQARGQGDPRYLGYAERLLDAIPDSRMTDRLRVLKATWLQSLHRFDESRAVLEQVLDNPDATRRNRIQALLTLANQEGVQGHYDKAEAAARRLTSTYPGLIAQSTEALIAARTGHAGAAYRDLNRALNNRPRAGAVEKAWVTGTLADLAAQLGLPAAEQHWLKVIQLDPTDLYSRAAYVDWLIQRQRYAEALTLTKGYEKVDPLAVSRTIALRAAGLPEARAMTERMDERFREARWRGNLLHKRDYARYLLDIADNPDEALVWARKNWVTQREPLDTRLLLRAARAAGDQDTLQATRDWLARHHQQDARYPESQP